MKNQLFSFLLSTSCLAAVNVPLTVQEALYSGGPTTGITRTNEPLTVGVPLPDSAGITGTGILGLMGASAAQFMVEGRWPGGNIKWVKVRAVVPGVSAGGTATITLTDGGSGNFGGANLATDNGATITVATGTATFTVKKAYFNGLDVVDIGSTHLVTTGASQGFVVPGPDPTAPYPGNVTCLPTPGGSACTTLYKSSNDPRSICSIEENGPAAAALKCTGNLTDGAGNVYTHFTARMYFYKNKNYVRVTPILRNADYGTSNTAAVATRGYQGFELRITPNLAGTLNYSIATHTRKPATGRLNQPGGTDSVYIYQAESNLLKSAGSCANGCVGYTTLSGYSIVANGNASQTGNAGQYPQGWADISDSSGAGVQIGQEQFAAYGNKSLEFLGGGTDARIGIQARENNSTSTSGTTPAVPYYLAWPQWSIPTDVYLNFHAAAVPNASDEFLKLQHPLLARANYSWYNTASVFPYPFLSPGEEDSYYNTVASTASPSVNSVKASDLTAGSTATADTVCSEFVCIFRSYSWASPGGANQMEFRLGHVYNFLRRGFTGGYLNALYFYHFAAASAFPMSDGFKWSAHGPQTEYYNYPCIHGADSGCTAIVSANRSRASSSWVEADGEHANIHGFPEFYFISGDETIREAVLEGYKDAYLSSTAASSYLSSTPTPAMWNDRAVGNVLKNISHLYNFLSAIGDADASTIRTNGERVYAIRLHPDFCASASYPSGCKPDKTDNNDNPSLQVGISRVRGVGNAFRDTSVGVGARCNGIIPGDARTAASFMNSIKLEGMWEFYKIARPAWQYYNEIFDNAYGSALWAFHEMYVDNGKRDWPGNGFRYKQAIDFPNACNASDDWGVKNEQTVWFPFFIRHQYEGGTSWKHEFDMLLQRDLSDTSTDEFFYYTIGAVINTVIHPNPNTLSTLPIIDFADNGGGSYTISWKVPAGAQSYRIKWGNKQIVDWIGFDAGSYTFQGNPATTMNWFGATDAPNIPTPSGSSQSLTINTGAPGLTVANFMVKAYVSSGVNLRADAPSPPVSRTSEVTASAATRGLALKPQGNSGRSTGATLTEAAPPDGGTPLPVRTWTALIPHGPPAQIVGFDKLTYVDGRKIHCVFGNYHQAISSEPDSATVCFSYAENRWFVLQKSGVWHSDHVGEGGHTDSIWAYATDRDTIVSMTDFAGSSTPSEAWLGHWWWFDVGGLSGRDKTFTPRPLPGITTPQSAMVYDSSNQKLVLFPDYNGVVQVCSMISNSCSAPKTRGAAPGNLYNPSMVYNSTDHKVYVFGGGQNETFTFDAAGNTWTRLTTKCGGADCTSNKPPARQAAGFAYSSTDHIFLMAGGVAGAIGSGRALKDTWVFDPATFQWTEQSPAGAYSNDSVNATFDRLTWDADSNVFILVAAGGQGNYADGFWNSYTAKVYAYAYGAALSYGRSAPRYMPPGGALNRIPPSSATNQSWAFDPALAAGGSTLYAGWIETGAPFDSSSCGAADHPYVQSIAVGGKWTGLPSGSPSGSMEAACVSIDPEAEQTTQASSLKLAVVNGALWEVHEKWNLGGISSSAWARQWTGTAWRGGQVGCFTAPCSGNLPQRPQGLIAVGSTPTLAVIEYDRGRFAPEGYVRIAQWNGRAWTSLGSNALNINGAGSGTRAGSAAIATDGTNPAVCWTEEVNSVEDRRTTNTTPQLQCKSWDGSQWKRFGSSSLNQNTKSWASSPTVTWLGGKYYIAWTERTTAGANQLYFCRWDGSSCALLGGGAWNINTTTGWATHPQLTNDGTNVYLAWEEQSDLGQPALAYVKRWNGSVVSQLGSALNADAVTGSVEGLTIVSLQGIPTAIWGELIYGNLRQIYLKQWNGTNWIPATRDGM